MAIGIAVRPRIKNAAVADRYVPRPRGTLTFSKDIGPILFDRCAYCHRPGEAAPFTLESYLEVKKRTKQIAEVTARRYMPPWLPESGYGEFADVRRLTEDQLGVIQQWIAEGAIEGDPADLPPAPKWPEGWQLGEPDLVVRMPEPYTLTAEGKDVYWNLVMPIPGDTRRYVRAVEFQPGNRKVVHHASFNLDQTGQSRRLAQNQTPPGFAGMQLPETATMVAGQLLGWEPGKRPEAAGAGLSWPLEKNTDLVLQLHLHPSGKPEQVQPVVGFYFTDHPPTNTPFLLRMPEWRIDIPAGASDYAVENSYVLPVDVEVLRVSPHAHYLGKELQGYAILPDGIRKWLLLIKKWDFNWQGDYRYASPVFLPKGTTLVMHFTYDNSSDNIRNPNTPPRRVRFGAQTTDEMAQLTLQVLARNAEDRRMLAADHLKKMTLDAIAYNESILRENPDDPGAHAKIGQALLPLGRYSEAFDHLRTAIRLNPGDDKAHYDLGSLYVQYNRLAEARAEFETVLRLNPEDYQAHGNLGAIHHRQGDYDLAEFHFESALRLNPDDTAARRNLDLVRAAKRALQRGR
ncbi:MAG TPA: tetratricopeptide repeat protein [Verrucomicrobiae bacterium]|nr:tetratricopeptide repeat protein [Verrucomicrobiae bacterium]